MRFSVRLAAGVLFAAFAVSIGSPTSTARAADEPKPPAGFTAIFNGKDLSGWDGHTTMAERAQHPAETIAELKKKRTEAAQEHWSVKDGVIQLDGKQCTKWIVDKRGKVVNDKGTMGLNLATAKD